MRGETFKILAGMLALRQFTGAELADATGVNPHTVNSWIRRKASEGKFVVEEGREHGGKGRPRIIWAVREEDVEDLRREVADLSSMPQTQREISTEDEAAEAFADTDVRDGIRYHMRRVARAESQAERGKELDKAHHWYQHERERLQDWIDAGFVCPEDVSSEVTELGQWLEGLTVSVDKLLGLDRKLRGVEAFADWLERAISAWFAPDGPLFDAFAPLSFRLSDDGNRRQSLTSNLMILLETAENVATVPRERLLCALLMVLPRLTDPEAYRALCDVFARVGHDALGEAIQHRMENVHDIARQRKFIYQTLAGLEQHTPLLRNRIIGAWVDGLLTHRLYSPLYIVLLLLCLEHRPQADPSRLMVDKIEELDLLRMGINESSEEWLAVNQEVQHLTGYLEGHAERLLSLAQDAQERAARSVTDMTFELADQFTLLFAPSAFATR